MNKSKFLRLILRLYLSPILSNSRLYLFAKDLFFSRNSEHIYRSINKIKDVTSQELLKESYIIDIGAHGDGFTSVFAENFPDCKISEHFYIPRNRLYNEDDVRSRLLRPNRQNNDMFLPAGDLAENSPRGRHARLR